VGIRRNWIPISSPLDFCYAEDPPPEGERQKIIIAPALRLDRNYFLEPRQALGVIICVNE
jgi:hypothetical protein